MYDYKVLEFKTPLEMDQGLSKYGKQGWRAISIIRYDRFTLKLVVTLEKKID